MQPRVFHNLVTLPDGKVLVMGGASVTTQGLKVSAQKGVQRPQIWDPATGLWSHVGGRPEPPQSLDAIRYDEGRMAWQGHRHQEPEERLADYLDEARQLLAGSPAPVCC